MPKMSALNGLLVEPIPDELQLNDVERPGIFEVISMGGHFYPQSLIGLKEQILRRRCFLAF